MIKYLLTILLSLATLLSDTINVPEDFPTIQGALNAANNDDVIMISEGTYFESNINPNGKTITITGEINDLGEPLVTIDGEYNESVLNFVPGLDFTPNTSIVENLIIKRGSSSFTGGGINAPQGLTINNCIFDDNRAVYGAGVAFNGDSNAMSTIQNCIFKNQLEHSSSSEGLFHPELGSAVNAAGNMTITNCIFENNASLSTVVFIGGTALIDSCIFNNHFDGGTLIGLQGSTDLTIINSNLIDNDAYPISISGFSTALLENNLFRNNTGTVSIMQSNATINQCQFENTELWIGEFDPISVSISDSEFCDNGGDSASDSIEGPWIDLGENNFSDICEEVYLGDINADGIINVLDVVVIVNIVLNNEYNELADLNDDNIINVLDIVQIVNIILN
tara:strand:- start:42 stop:1223 length:1182 start_codon:yes stop_codon:yes gene_type:complete